MTLQEVRRTGAAYLQEAKAQDAPFEADCLLAAVLHCDKTHLLLRADEALTQDEEKQYRLLLENCARGEPLQYLLGEWEFLDLTLQVGRGVLIPRPETEQLAILTAQQAHTFRKPVILDLCAGSGCIGLYCAKACPGAKVFLLEYEKEAFAYLQKNAQNLTLQNIQCVYADIRHGYEACSLPMPQIIVSNPPYIPTGQLSALQREVQYEPRSALDGGTDGLDFYRVLHSLWFSALQSGGQMLLECGDGQAKSITKLFHGAAQAQIVKDYNGIERMLVLTR